MSLERQNLVVKMNPDDLDDLRDYCETHGTTMAEFVETLVVTEISHRFHMARVLTEKRAARKRSGSRGE